MATVSLNALAEERKLKPFSSWDKGKPAGYFPLPLPAEAKPFYDKNGFLVVEGAFTAEEVQQLRDEAAAICRGERGQIHGIENGDPAEDVLARYLCIHFPHKVSDLMYGALSHRGFTEALTKVIGPNVKCMQSMLFIKSAGKPGQAWHQDEIYIPTRDRSLIGGWLALDDATVENGCLWVIPGSQAPGVLYFQEWHGDSRFDCALEAKRFPYSNDQAVPVEVKAGSAVFFNGYLLHRSLPNYADTGYRRALVNHYMSAESLLPWAFSQSALEGGVGSLDTRDVVIVAGEDPYAWRGYEDHCQAHVRPSGKGGCGNQEYNR